MEEAQAEEPVDRDIAPAGVTAEPTAVAADAATLAAEVAALASDPSDRAEIAEVRAMMEGMAPT